MFSRESSAFYSRSQMPRRIVPAVRAEIEVVRERETCFRARGIPDPSDLLAYSCVPRPWRLEHALIHIGGPLGDAAMLKQKQAGLGCYNSNDDALTWWNFLFKTTTLDAAHACMASPEENRIDGVGLLSMIQQLALIVFQDVPRRNEYMIENYIRWLARYDKWQCKDIKASKNYARGAIEFTN
ncbi:hypothetical protein Tco_0137766 [Tanacetum coccineum]